jgi:hypothetical protein
MPIMGETMASKNFACLPGGKGANACNHCCLIFMFSIQTLQIENFSNKKKNKA